jgi:hypothetical protein
MASELTAVLLSAALIGTALAALFSKKVSNSLIALFYTSIVLGVAFTVYGDALVGLLTMVTFAGAVSVLLLAVILITGESKLDIGARWLALGLSALTIVVGVASFSDLFSGGSPSNISDVSLNVLNFAWQSRPWDLLILVVVLSGAMVGVVHLLGGDQ